jgi:hypothetical protein
MSLISSCKFIASLSSRLTTEDEALQLQSARLEIEDEDGEIRTYLQVKLWGKARDWCPPNVRRCGSPTI